MRRLLLLAWMCGLMCLVVSARAARPACAAEDADPPGTQADAPSGAEARAETAKSEGSEDGKAEAGPTDSGQPGPAEASAETGEEPKAPKKATVVCLTIKGSYPERSGVMGIFSQLEESLPGAIRRIDAAAEDSEVAAMWLRIEGLGVGRGKLHELRSALARFRKAGKPLYAELTTAGTSQYLLASACDEIVMPPSGTLILPGVRAEVTFYKGLLDKLGIQCDMLQMGKYKGAAEPLTREHMSEPLRESMEAMVDDVYGNLVTVIAAERNLSACRVRMLLDQALFTAPAARKAGLIDHVAYADQFRNSVRDKLGVDEIDLVTHYRKKKMEADFSGLAGMMKMMELFLGGRPTKRPSEREKIAVVYAVGLIMEGAGGSDFFGDSMVGSTTVVKALREATDDPKVVAIVLRVDSPGGSATASDLIWRETVRIQKPIIASMGDLAGSGGYYIAMGADKILAEPGTVTGSIGVVGGKIVTRGLFDKIGVTTEVIARGKSSGLLSSNAPFTSDERKALKGLLKEVYRQFVEKAARGRNLPRKQLSKLAQGRVYTGRMAAANGLIDELGTLKDAIAAAKKAAGLKPDEEVDLLILPRPKTFFEQLFGDTDLSTAVRLAPAEVVQPLRTAGQLRKLFAEPTLMWMPYHLRLQ